MTSKRNADVNVNVKNVNLNICYTLVTNVTYACTNLWTQDQDKTLYDPLMPLDAFGRQGHKNYRIRPNYRTYPYVHTVKQFRSLQITASVLFVYFFVKAYVVGTHLNCIDLSMQFK